MELPLSTVMLIPAAAVLAVLLTTAVGRVVQIPLVVFEIVLGRRDQRPPVASGRGRLGDRAELEASTAASLVGAGMISVLGFPLLAFAHRGSRTAEARTVTARSGHAPPR